MLNLFVSIMVVIGMDDPNDPHIPIKEALKDEKRIRYHNDYLSNLLASIKYVHYVLLLRSIIYYV